MKKTMILIVTALLICSTPVKTEADDIADLRAYADQVAEEYGICEELVESLIYYESHWNTKAVSEDGAMGLMQVMPAYNKDRMERLGVTDLYDGKQNILVGVDLLAELSNEYEVYEALTAYNCGEYSKTLEAVVNGGSWEYADAILENSAKLERERGK